jgi:class 3 adenylate cyclase
MVTDSSSGLSEREASERLAREGFNEIPSSDRSGLLRAAGDVLGEPMFLLLLACGGIYVLVGDLHEALILLGFVVLVAAITLYQEESSDPTAADLAARVESLAPSLERFLAYVWRRHLLAALRRWSAQPSPTDRAMMVGFADLVGFTALSRALAPRDLAKMIDRFESLAYEHIPERGGRIVKMIGDEVMFEVANGGVAADIAITLVEACARDADVPALPVGLASGLALSMEGDLYGPSVNLASRLVNLARPGTVLVSDELGVDLQNDPRFELRHLRAVNLHGVGRVRLWVLRRARA